MKKLQNKIRQVRKERGFTMDPLKIFIHLNEEIGEIASELKKIWSLNYEDFSKEKLEEEIADTQSALIALANQFNIDIEKAVLKKFFKKDSQRIWQSQKLKM